MKFRIINLLLLTLLVIIPRIGPTGAYFSDYGNTLNNIYSVGSVDFSLFGGSDISAIVPGYSGTQALTVTKDGTLDFEYKLNEITRAGDTAFCDALGIDGNLGDIFTISGKCIGIVHAIFPVC